MKLHNSCVSIIKLQVTFLSLFFHHETSGWSFTPSYFPSNKVLKPIVPRISRTTTAKSQFGSRRSSQARAGFQFISSNDNNDCNNDNDYDNSPLLFFASRDEGRGGGGEEEEEMKLAATETQTTTKTKSDTVSSTKITTSDAEKLKYQARKMKLEAEKMEAELTLQKIQALEDKLNALDNGEVSGTSSEGTNNLSKEVLIQQGKMDIKKQIQNLAKNINPELLPILPLNFDSLKDEEEELNAVKRKQMKMNKEGKTDRIETNLYKTKDEAASNVVDQISTSTTTSKPRIETNLYKDRMISQTSESKPITEAELQSAVEYYLSLPKPVRKALARAIDLDDEKTSPSIIVLGLYEFMNTSSLSSFRLNHLYNDQLTGKSLQQEKDMQTTMDRAMSMIESNNQNGIDSTGWIDISKTRDNQKLEVMVESFLPRVTRKEGTEPTLADVNMLKTSKILGKDTFQMSLPPQQVPGGYILRGEMVSKLRGDCNELVRLLDEKIESSTQLPSDWKEKYQIDIMTDPTPTLFENEENFDGDLVLVVHSRDMTPTTNRLLLSAVSTVSLFFTFVFVIATYSQNQIVMDRLTTANSVGDYDLTWFNELISPLLISLGVSQAIHEAGHLFIAKKDGFKITPPTILPLIALPYMSLQQNIKTSPKNFDSLFNFGMIGPALGMISSFAFFLIGLQLTLTMDANALEYAPSVPVLFLKLSTLGGSIVDNVIGGGQGIITQQDPLTPVKLHPFAIGGLASLMINCLDTIPLPGTDGGRMSQSLLGRSGQVAFGGVTYFALLAYTFISGHNDIFLSFLLINSFSRQDNEIPCRNEIDRAGLGQAAIALVMWSIAILTLTPLD